MIKSFLILLLFLFFLSCHSAKEKAKDVVNKAGETAGEVTTDLVKSVKAGIDKSLDCEIQLSDKLKQDGIATGKFIISKTSDSGDNILSLYLIFSKDVKANISAKVFDSKGLEYGRTSAAVKAKAGEAKYFDFVFDKRTDIESKSKFLLE